MSTGWHRDLLVVSLDRIAAVGLGTSSQSSGVMTKLDRPGPEVYGQTTLVYVTCPSVPRRVSTLPRPHRGASSTYSEASASLNVALGRMTASALAGSGR